LLGKRLSVEIRAIKRLKKNEYLVILFSQGALFLTVISGGTQGNHIFCDFVARKKEFPSRYMCNEMGSPRLPWEYFSEIRMPVKLFLLKPFF
jgi:hypothetical protein